MGLTKFPNGVSSFGVPVIGSGENIPTTTGTYFFVSSGTGSASNDGLTPQTPVATLQQAIDKCTAAKGDVILLMPGHAETVTSGSIVVNKSGISIVSLGQGALRATFTFSTDVTIAVSAANCSWKNCRFIANFADVAVGLTVSGVNFQLIGNEFTEAGADLNWFTCVATGATDNTADGLTIVGNFIHQEDAAAKAPFSILQAMKNLVIADNSVRSAGTSNVGHFLILAAKIITGARILRNHLIVTGATDATVGIFITGSGTTSTGIVAQNFVGSLDTTTELIMTAGTGLTQFENYYTGTADASGKLWPAVDGA